jgi:uncharacterized protein
MDRFIDTALSAWSKKTIRKPLLLRGARQTGKTYSVRKLSTSFNTYIEINFEQNPRFCGIFKQDLQTKRICKDISALSQKHIIPGETLLFLDEIQVCPEALLCLRYFFEEQPDLHVIAAGSLLEFELQNISVPVGRIEFMFVRPMTFMEYLRATESGMLADQISGMNWGEPPGTVIHDELLRKLKEYMYIGGMPGVIRAFIEEGSYDAAEREQRDIVQTYRADFTKYTRRAGIEMVEKVFASIPSRVGQKTVYSDIDPDARAFQLRNAVDLLTKARILSKVRQASGAGVPLAAGASDKHYKTIFLDVGLMQRLCGLRYEDWLNANDILDAHRGSVTEQFTGQELLHRDGLYEDPGLFYWHRDSKGSRAEVDYIVEFSGKAIPLEVKSSASGHLRSLHSYIATFPRVPFGIKCSIEPLVRSGQVLSIPLYAVSETERLYRSAVISSNVDG